jgi:hypothetical protein
MVFGCEAYVHVPKENKSKLDKKDEKCIFIGYKDGMKGYKIWNPETKKVVYNEMWYLEKSKMFSNKKSYQGRKNRRK